MRHKTLIIIYVFSLLNPLTSYANEKMACTSLLKEIASDDKSGISTENQYQILWNNGAYLTMINKYLSEYGIEKEDKLSRFYASDALISLALEKSSSPHLPESAISVVAEEKDIVDIDLARTLSEINPNIWSKKISSKFGEANLCVLKDIFENSEEIYDLQKRYISTMVLMGDFDKAIKATKKLKIRSISVYEFSQVGEVFIGVRKPVQAALFIKALTEKHGLENEQQQYWLKFIHKFIDIENYSKQKRSDLHAKVSRIFNIKNPNKRLWRQPQK